MAIMAAMPARPVIFSPSALGAAVGSRVGAGLGAALGAAVGSRVGAALGAGRGAAPKDGKWTIHGHQGWTLYHPLASMIINFLSFGIHVIDNDGKTTIT